MYCDYFAATIYNATIMFCLIIFCRYITVLGTLEHNLNPLQVKTQDLLVKHTGHKWIWPVLDRCVIEIIDMTVGTSSEIIKKNIHDCGHTNNKTSSDCFSVGNEFGKWYDR